MIRRKMDSIEPVMILEKIRHYCGYQERCIRDVEEKLKDWAVQKKRIPVLINQLQKEGFLNEERFVKAFARGKFRLNKWGRQKIEFALKIKGIPDILIREGIESLDEKEYLNVLKELILRKQKELKPEKDLMVRDKIVNFALGKGYEMNLILDLIKKLKI
jgi:regulatory protein